MSANRFIGAVCAIALGVVAVSTAEIQQEGHEGGRLAGLAMSYYALGRLSESDAALEELIAKHGQTIPIAVAYALGYRGEVDRTFEWLDKAVQYHDPSLGSVPVDPALANLRSDPRWLPFLRRYGMAPEQLAAIKFDVTVPR